MNRIKVEPIIITHEAFEYTTKLSVNVLMKEIFRSGGLLFEKHLAAAMSNLYGEVFCSDYIDVTTESGERVYFKMIHRCRFDFNLFDLNVRPYRILMFHNLAERDAERELPNGSLFYLN